MAMVVTNACAPDPRVLRHARWMQEAGYTVTVHAFDRGEQHPMSENHHGVRIMRYRLGPVAYGGTINTYRGIRRFQQKVVRTLANEPPAWSIATTPTHFAWVAPSKHHTMYRSCSICTTFSTRGFATLHPSLEFVQVSAAR